VALAIVYWWEPRDCDETMALGSFFGEDNKPKKGLGSGVLEICDTKRGSGVKTGQPQWQFGGATRPLNSRPGRILSPQCRQADPPNAAQDSTREIRGRYVFGRVVRREV